MKKNTTSNYDEIDFIALLKIIWDGRVKIFLVVTISFLIAFTFSIQIPQNYQNTLSISENDNYEFAKIQNIYKLIAPVSNNHTSKFYQTKFINEFKDYEEFILNLKNIKIIRDKISKLKIQDQEVELFKYSKYLKIVSPKNNQENFIIKFNWHDPDEAKKILKDALNLTSKNLKQSIDLELENQLEFKKKLTINEDIKRLQYLKEQSSIAKELKIEDNQIDNVNFFQSSVSLRINTADIAYYFRGYKAIDKEIQLIQNRDYHSLKFAEQELDTFKDTEINFVNYNIHFMDIKSLKDTKLIYLTSILIGLIVGLFYVIISNVIQSRSVSKK